MKIIHLSDLHLGFDSHNKKNNSFKRFQKIIDTLIFLKEPSEDYVVIISGDIVDDANIPDIHVQAQKHIQYLENAGFKILLCPGNHDYGNGIYGKTIFVNKFKLIYFGDETISYPKLDIINYADNKSTAFIGLDSMVEELHWYDALFADGELGKKQLNKLYDILTSTQVQSCTKRVIYLHHHPFQPVIGNSLKDSTEFLVLLDKVGNVDTLLFGHNHYGDNFNGSNNIARCYDGGSSTRKQFSTSSIRVIDLDKDIRMDYTLDIITYLDIV